MEHEMIPVPRAELLAWAKAWLHDYGPNDGTDCVTPFDTYLLKSPVEAHCTTCACVPGMTLAVRFDATPAEKDGAVRDHLIRMGWTPPADFDAWQQNPYTKVLMKSIAEDYVPKHVRPIAVSAPVGVEDVEAALQKWLDWCNEHNEEPEARAGARIAVEALAQQTMADTTKPRAVIVLHVDTDGGLNFTSSEDVDVLVIDYDADLDYYEDDEITKVEQAIGPRVDAVVYFAAVDTVPAYTKSRVRTYRATDGRNC